MALLLKTSSKMGNLNKNQKNLAQECLKFFMLFTVPVSS